MGNDVTLSRSEAFDVLAALEGAAAQLADTDQVGLLLEVENAVALLVDRLFPDLEA